jgi:hypothetical protein
VPQLTYLDISETDTELPQVFEALCHCPQLESLICCKEEAKFGDAGSKRLVSASHLRTLAKNCPKLLELNLCGCRLHNSHTLSAISAFKRLQKCSIDSSSSSQHYNKQWR